MKILPGDPRGAAARPQPRPTFLRVLRSVPAPKPAAEVAAGLRCHLRPARPLAHATPGSAEGLRTVRQGLHAEVARLGEARAHAVRRGEQQCEQRAMELIARELGQEPPREGAALPAPVHACELRTDAAPGLRGDSAPSTRAVGAADTRGEAPAATPGPELRAEAALALIERIELFVRSGRPAMALSVGGALAATVELERTGPREVALRIQGRRGPPAAAELAQVREALEARGLHLRSLHAS